jgi:membrane protein
LASSLKSAVALARRINFYDLLELYGIGAEGALSNRAELSRLVFYGFVSFRTFILNLIPIYPIEGFQADFLNLLKRCA